jgi:hypothetical protein
MNWSSRKYFELAVLTVMAMENKMPCSPVDVNDVSKEQIPFIFRVEE